ncbi:hypothetical protein JXB41_02125 [Candidatus Woesearchaeota archaeon]|nr:hypothetical protein [Candidatus Woesearchaeota archaeon]
MEKKIISKKANLPIYVIFSIIITVAGILLVFILIGSNANLGKKVYCRTLYNNEKSTDEFCEEYLSLKTETMLSKSSTLEVFSDNREKGIINLSEDNYYKDSIGFILPSNAKLREAKLRISLTNQTINRFADGNSKEIIIVPPGSDFNAVYAATLQGLPLNAKLLNPKLEISGEEFPSKADIAFVIDTSRSMSNEWQTVCNNLNYIKSYLLKLGLDTNITIYSLGAGIASQDCVDVTLSKDNLTTIRTLVEFDGNSNHKSGSHFEVNHYDDYEECWAVGISYIARNHPWRFQDDVKRIIIPVSDSDPTGGGPVRNNNKGIVQGPGKFTGSEWPAVRQAIADCTLADRWIYILPIEGDEPASNALPVNNEGFGVGSIPCEDTCANISEWMSLMINETTGRDDIQVESFKNKTSIFDAIIKIITTPFPENITVYLDNQEIWELMDEQLNKSTSPKAIDTDEFFTILNNMPCKTNQCNITITSSEGTIILDKLRIKFIQDPDILNLNIGGNDVDVDSLALNSPSIERDIFTQVENALLECYQEERECKIQINIHSENQGIIELGVNIEYSYYSLEEDLLENILDCWRDSSYGKEENNFICNEFIVNQNYIFNYPLTEELITGLIKQRNFCHIIENSRDASGNLFDCGEQDNLLISQDIYNTDNILIEYDAENKQIIVS